MCGGHGKVRASQGFFSIERTCPTCQGRGQTIKDPCPKCSGQGRIVEERSLSVNIPSGIEDGTRIRLANEGEAGLRGGPSGDLYIFLSVKPHEFFQRDGADLYCKVPISMTTAALGGSFEVATLDGTQTRVKVPEGTQNGRQFRLKGKGMPVLRQPQIGDLYIQTAVETPQNLDQAPARTARRVREAVVEGKLAAVERLLLAHEGLLRVVRRALIATRRIGSVRSDQKRQKPLRTRHSKLALTQRTVMCPATD